ncbi:MFS transporter [Actinomadura verrucosospora]|uniref:EmrB/QacA family drug resistance transporter n=1 Tax=Actinomadura verrucosospora TaxID=46165 RepID=A0A7D3ZVR7_ACTVE|nr:MFS transporter [Actinomadura verrucosospora]QKG20206.1 EmrB/QacA family drug resistance transporter [Actinomadura verrucosospora]
MNAKTLVRRPPAAEPDAKERDRFALAAGSAAAFMVFLGTTIVTLALPTMLRDLHGGPAAGEWIVNGYTLTLAAGLISAGALADVLGARRVFLAGLAVVAPASAVAAAAGAVPVLIAAQLAMGAGAALLLPSSLTLATSGARNTAGRARAVAVWGATGGVGLAAGPLVGGVLIAAAGWRAVFLVNVLLGAVAATVTLLRVGAVPARPRRIDVGGQLTAGAAIAGLVFGMIEGPHLGWTHPAVAAAGAVFAAGVAAFALAERRAADPLLPLGLFRRAGFSGTSALGVLFNFTFYGVMFALSLLLQDVKGEPPLVAGLSFLPFTGLIALGNLVTPTLLARFGTTAALLAGELLFGGAIAAILFAGPLPQAWPMLLAMTPAGLGAGIVVAAMTTRLVESVPAALTGAATAAFNTGRQVGSSAGVAVFGPLLAGAAFATGFRIALGIAVTAVAATVPITLALRHDTASTRPQ